MKSTAVFLLFVLGFFQAVAQCTADAGRSDTLCANSLDLADVFLGGSPTAQGGVPPYTYTWTCRYAPYPAFPSLNWTASDILDDTTAANPKMLHLVDSSLTFYVSVTDAAGDVCTDSVTYWYSEYVWSMDYKFAYLDPGDSVQLYLSIHGGIAPISYTWSPAGSLANASDPFTWAKPDTTTFYNLWAIDAAGCEGGDAFDVFVNPVGLSEPETPRPGVTLAPNPVVDVSHLTLSGAAIAQTFAQTPEQLSVQVFDSCGQLVRTLPMLGGKATVDRATFVQGWYVYRILQRGEIIAQGTMAVE